MTIYIFEKTHPSWGEISFQDPSRGTRPAIWCPKYQPLPPQPVYKRRFHISHIQAGDALLVEHGTHSSLICGLHFVLLSSAVGRDLAVTVVLLFVGFFVFVEPLPKVGNWSEPERTRRGETRTDAKKCCRLFRAAQWPIFGWPDFINTCCATQPAPRSPNRAARCSVHQGERACAAESERVRYCCSTCSRHTACAGF